jgi:hypothetical protein
MVMWQNFLACLNKFEELLQNTGSFESINSVPMVGFYGYLMEHPFWRTAS